MPSSPRRQPSRVALGYLLAVALGWLLGQWPAERTLPTLLLAYAPPLLWLLPAPLVWGWVLWRKRRVGYALLATLLALWGTGALHWRGQGPGQLRVLSYNVAGGRMTTPDKLATFLKSADPDIILLQETSYARPGFRDQLELRLPGYTAAHAAEVTTYTRLPMRSGTSFALPHNHRKILVTALEWRGQTLNVVNAHLGTVMLSPLLRGDISQTRRTRSARSAQVDVLRQLALQTPGKVLLGGDLNTPPRGILYRRLTGMYGPDAFDRAGRGPGWTFPGMKLRIDHQMTRDLRPTRAKVLAGAGSDHLPLLVEYR